MKKYTALIMDFKESRNYSLKSRRNIQNYVIEVIEILNLIFRKALAKKVEFSAGDELQGLFSSSAASFLYFRLFYMLISPLEIRAGFGVGDWNIRIEKAGTTAQDGEAYHNARKAIDSTENSVGYTVLLYSGSDNDIVTNSLINSTTLIINQQSEHQSDVMLLSELLYPIIIDGLIDTEYYNDLFEFTAYKKQLMRYVFASSNKSMKITEIFDQFQYKQNIPSFPIDINENQHDFFVTNGKTRGLPMRLAKIFSVSRQSMDKTIKAANVYEARNLAIATLRYLSN